MGSQARSILCSSLLQPQAHFPTKQRDAHTGYPNLLSRVKFPLTTHYG